MKESPNKKNYIATGIMTWGALLLAAALLLTVYNIWDKHRAEKAAASVLVQLREEWEAASNTGQGQSSPAIPDYILNPAMEMRSVTIDGHSYIGTVMIPVLDIELPVMESWSNEQMKTAPCRYHGTPYKGHFIIAAHNYETHFGKIKNLKEGDEIIFTDMEQNEFRYTVAKLETLSSKAVEEMKSGGWDLTLFTCTLSGAQRITVRCQAQPS